MAKQSLDAAAAGVAIPAETLLNGLGRVLHFLFENEADYICGAPLHMRSHKRVNYRIGYYARKFPTHLGTIPIRIPHLLHFTPRVPMVKRAKRLSGEILAALGDIHAGGAMPGNISNIIKTVWTMELPDKVLADLTRKLAADLEAWRAGEQ